MVIGSHLDTQIAGGRYDGVLGVLAGLEVIRTLNDRGIETKRPIIVSDALTDTTFGKSESVLALQLSSVMCAPLISQGEVVGALYVGNDEVKHLFDRQQLDLLVIFAGQASLILSGNLTSRYAAAG